VTKRKRRTDKHIVNFKDGYSVDWYFDLPEAYKSTLDIKLDTLQEKPKTSQKWTQGSDYKFNVDDTFYNNKLAYKLPWKEALKHFSVMLQVKAIVSNRLSIEVWRVNDKQDDIEIKTAFGITPKQFVILLKTGRTIDIDNNEVVLRGGVYRQKIPPVQRGNEPKRIVTVSATIVTEEPGILISTWQDMLDMFDKCVAENKKIHDFVEYLRQFCFNNAKADEFIKSLPQDLDIETELQIYLTIIWQSRKINFPMQPREVWFAEEFEKPPERLRTNYKELLDIFKNGTNDIAEFKRKFLPKAWQEATFNKKSTVKIDGIDVPVFIDKLFAHWSIMHFHLESHDKDAIIYAVLTYDVVCMIDFRWRDESEISGHESLYDDELVRIAYRNWPKLYKNNILYGITGDNLGTNVVKNIRIMNMGHNIDVDGVCLTENVQQGTLCNGMPLEVLFLSDKMCNEFSKQV